MRKALNDNPIVQIAVLGVLAVVVGFFLMTRVMGKSSDSTSTTPTDPPPRPRAQRRPPTARSPSTATEAPTSSWHRDHAVGDAPVTPGPL